MNKLRLGIDVDEVLGDLHTPWVEWGNKKFETNYSEFNHWDAPTEWWGRSALGFLRPEIYIKDIVKPIYGAVDTIRQLRSWDNPIKFVTSCNRQADIETAKLDWLRRHGFLMHDDEFMPRVNKSNVDVDILVDDGYHNVSTFKNQAVLVSAAHNANDLWYPRIQSIRDLPIYLMSREDAFAND